MYQTVNASSNDEAKRLSTIQPGQIFIVTHLHVIGGNGETGPEYTIIPQFALYDSVRQDRHDTK